MPLTSLKLRQEVLPAISSALEHVEPFVVALHAFGFFARRKDGTMFLQPQTRTAESCGLQQLHRRLVSLFPDCVDEQHPEFHPHLTVGQWPSKELAREAPRLQAAWHGVDFLVDSVCLISRRGFEDPFEIRHRVRLGKPSSS
jgi:2'-5' RNA ligase